MIVALSKSTFASELAAVSAVVKTKQTIPSLGYVLLTANSEGFFITVTDLDCWYKRTAEAIVKKQGECLIPLRTVREWLNYGSDELLTISYNDQRVTFSVDGGQSISFSTIPTTDFPKEPSAIDETSVGFMDLKPITQVLFAAAPTNAREELYGIYVEPDGSNGPENDDGAGLIAFAANGVQCATVKFQGEQKGLQRLFIRPPMVLLIAGLGLCEVSDSKNFTIYTTPTCVLMDKKSTARQIDWRPVLTLHPIIAGFNVLLEDIAAAVGSCHCLRGADDYSRILFSKNEAGVSVSTHATAGAFVTVVPAKNTGDWPMCSLPSPHVLTFLNEQKRREEDVLKFRFSGHYTLLKVNAGALDWYVQPIADTECRATIESIQPATPKGNDAQAQ